MANKNHSTGNKQGQVVVVVVPLPMQGHLNQLLHLSRLLSVYSIPVHFVGTATHNRQARLRVQGWNPASCADIHFHDLSLPSFPCRPLPNPKPNPNPSLTKFPSHLLHPCVEASRHLRKPVGALLRELSSNNRRVVVIHDSLMASVVQDFVSLPNAESYIFHSVSAFAMLLHFWESMGKPSLGSSSSAAERIIRGLDVPPSERCFSAEFLGFMASQHDCQKFKSGRLFNTSRLIEKPFMDLMDSIINSGKTSNWAIGPFNPVENRTAAGRDKHQQRHRCLEWLDQQAPKSVIYVCFGTTTLLTEVQIHEIALGLERSEQRFLWVVRQADKGDVLEGEEEENLDLLPEGFEARVEKVGLVVRDWAPQLEILGHPSIGAFMSHCGWNSCMESITMGVPMAAWPMHSDQPSNTVLVTRFLHIATLVSESSHHRLQELVSSRTLENCVRKLMASKHGDDLRKKAAELGVAVRRSMADGGASRLELESFISHISR